MIMAAGHIKQTQWISVTEAIINIVLSLILVKWIGIIGVALGTLIAFAFNTVANIVYMKKYIFDMSLGWIIKVYLANLVAGVLAMCLFGNIVNAHITGFISFFIWAAVVFAGVCLIDVVLNYFFFKNETKILTTSATRNSSLEKMSGALVSYELMLDDASLLPKDVVKNLAIQYLGWNYTIFQHMIREKERTSSLYEKVKSNCVCYQEYSCYLGLADRIGINAIAKHNYTCAKLSVQAVGIMQLIKKKICRIVKKQV